MTTPAEPGNRDARWAIIGPPCLIGLIVAMLVLPFMSTSTPSHNVKTMSTSSVLAIGFANQAVCAPFDGNYSAADGTLLEIAGCEVTLANSSGGVSAQVGTNGVGIGEIVAIVTVTDNMLALGDHLAVSVPIAGGCVALLAEDADGRPIGDGLTTSFCPAEA